MNLYDIAIRRPVFTFMLMLALVVFGILGYQTLPVNLLPSIDFPMVTVITILPGASPEVMESDVTDVIEAAVNTIEGIDQLTSYSGQGVSQVTVMFTTERDVDIAAQDCTGDGVTKTEVEGKTGGGIPVYLLIDHLGRRTQLKRWIYLAGIGAANHHIIEAESPLGDIEFIIALKRIGVNSDHREAKAVLACAAAQGQGLQAGHVLEESRM